MIKYRNFRYKDANLDFNKAINLDCQNNYFLYARAWTNCYLGEFKIACDDINKIIYSESQKPLDKMFLDGKISLLLFDKFKNDFNK